MWYCDEMNDESRPEKRRLDGLTFTEVVARRVNQARRRQGWTQQDLAMALAEVGTPIHQSTIAKIERGSRGISVDEAFHLAAALGIAPVHLFVPLEDRYPRIQVTSSLQLSPSDAREWIKGQLPLEDAHDLLSFYYSDVPEDEFADRIREVYGEDATIEDHWDQYPPAIGEMPE